MLPSSRGAAEIKVFLINRFPAAPDTGARPSGPAPQAGRGRPQLRRRNRCIGSRSKDYGFKLTFGGFIKADEMTQWKAESEKALTSVNGRFGVMVDMRTLKPLPGDAQGIMVEGQKGYKEKGMERSAVILDSSITTAQFRRLAKESGIYAWERHVSAADTPHWEKVGADWISLGIDPDK